MRKEYNALVEVDAISQQVAQAFDVPFTGLLKFISHERPPVGDDWGVGVIVGGSGTGKTLLLREFGTICVPEWQPNRAIASHFSTAEESMKKLSAAGLSVIPDWVKPYPILSTGQKFRADLARSLFSGAVVDEFSSVVDRQTAISASVALARYVKREGLRRMVLATCHRDILPWLEPDWVFDTDCGKLLPRGWVRPRIEAALVEGSSLLWPMFAPFHYLSAKLSPSARCFYLFLGERPVGFYAAMPQPGALKHTWRGHRSVILPEYQGLGLGVRMAETVGDILLGEGKRFFCRTAHPWVGQHRSSSPKWRVTQTNLKKRRQYKKEAGDFWMIDDRRICFSHEYLGDPAMRKSTSQEIKEAKPRLRKPIPRLQGPEGDRVYTRIMAGEDVKTLSDELGLRKSYIYRLLKYRGTPRREMKKEG